MTRYKDILFLSFMVLLTFSCNKTDKEFNAQGQTVLLSTSNGLAPDSIVESIIDPYHQFLDKEMNRVLGFSSMILEKGTPEGPLNNFVADLVLLKGRELYDSKSETPIDFCLLNSGGLRVPIPQGEITYSRIYELLPFENEMVVVTLNGEKTAELFHYLAESTVGMPVSGIKLTISNKSVQSVLIGGDPFNANQTYKILTSDYLADGGDDMIFFAKPLNYEYVGLKVRDAIIGHIESLNNRGEKIEAAVDGRISITNQ